MKYFSPKYIEAMLINNYMLLVVAAYFARFVIDIRPALIYLTINIVIIMMRILTVIQEKAQKRLPLLFAIILLFSGLFSALYSTSLSVFLNSILYVGTPMIFCFSCTNEHLDLEQFLKNTAIAVLICLVFGTVCFYTKPGFFIEYTRGMSAASYENLTHWAGVGRLVTLVGSIETGILSCFLTFISWGFVIQKKYKTLGVIGLIVGIGCVILTQQRGPLFSIILIVLFSFLFGYRDRLLKPKFIILGLIVVLAVFWVLANNNPIVYQWMVERVTNPADAITERYDYQWGAISENFSVINYLTGQGLGTFSQFAKGYVKHDAILDQMYFNMIGEIGIVGLGVFLSIVVSAMIKSLRNLKRNFTLLAIIFAFCFIGLGTTLIYYPMITPVVWFCIGQLLYVNDGIQLESALEN